jgi:hypothetical protein
MALKIVRVTFEDNGDAEVDLSGFHGKGCGAIQEGFAKAHGTATEVAHKPEFNKPCLTQTKIKQ